MLLTRKAPLALLMACTVSTASAGVLTAASKQELTAGQQFSEWINQQGPASFADSTDQFIIQYNGKVDIRKDMQRMAKSLKGSVKHKKDLGNNRHVFKLSSKLDKKEQAKLLATLRRGRSVSSAEMDPVRYFMSQSSPWGIANVQADQLSDSTASNMTVCIIDSGYDINNPDLSANNHSGTNDSGTGNWYQAGGSHGTHVAGTIAAVNNSEGVVGVMPNANVNLHIVKVFNASGWGYSSDLVTAVNTCVNNGAKVVNMSLGGPSDSTSERNSLASIANSGVLLVAASGNDGNSSLSYPASYDSVMAVGAVDENGQHAEFSQYTSQVEVAAPGEAVLSTVAGDGRTGSISVGGSSYGDAEGVVPQSHYIQSGGNYVISNVNGTVSGTLASCSRSGSSYSCGNMSNRICIAERDANQAGSSYPEINAAKACADAGAAGVIVYSNSARPGLQNPFLVDANNDVNVPSVSVNRATGQALLSQTGQSATLSVLGNQDYDYYNGTSMATPHAAAVAALAWSNNIDCSATDVRNALKATAIDLDVSGRDDRTGYGLVQAKAASDYLASNCDSGTTPPPSADVLENGVAKTGLSGSTGTTLSYTMEVPAGATDLSFDMSGGSGDADLYVKFGSAPSANDYDCRPYASGNNESCPISNVQAGTYYVNVVAYSSFSSVSLTGSFTEPSGGGTGGEQGWSGGVADIDISRRQWVYYTIDVPAGMSVFNVDIANGSGDADLYVRYGAQPTSGSYDCRPYLNGNNESCSFDNPQGGTWHIGIYAYSRVRNVDLAVEYQP